MAAAGVGPWRRRVPAALLALAAPRLVAAARLGRAAAEAAPLQKRAATLEETGVDDPVYFSECLDDLLNVDDELGTPMLREDDDEFADILGLPEFHFHRSASQASIAFDVMLAAEAQRKRPDIEAPSRLGAEAGADEGAGRKAKKRRRTAPVVADVRAGQLHGDAWKVRWPSIRTIDPAPMARPMSPPAVGRTTFPVKDILLTYMQAGLESALLAADCPHFRPWEVAYEVTPPSDAKPGAMLNVSVPFHGFMPVIVPKTWQAGQTIPVQYEVSNQPASRRLAALQKRRYIDKLSGRLAAKADHAAPMTREDAKKCYSFVDRHVWLQLLQVELHRLPRPPHKCPMMTLTLDITDLPNLRWSNVDVAGTFKMYLSTLNFHTAERCARLAADVALQIAPAAQRNLVALHYHIHFVSNAAELDIRFPECDVDLVEGVLSVANTTVWPQVPNEFRRLLWLHGCPEVRLNSAVRVTANETPPGERAIAKSPDGNVCLDMPSQQGQGRAIWAVYPVTRVTTATVMPMVFLYAVALSQERQRTAEFGVDLPARLCISMVGEALQAMLPN